MQLFKLRPASCPMCKANLSDQDASFHANPKCGACGVDLEPSYGFNIIIVMFAMMLGLWLQYRFTLIRLLFAIALILGFGKFIGTRRWKVQGRKTAVSEKQGK
jgi:hypothetical protein